MSRPTITWTLLALIYGIFTSWYTSCAGPLSAEEIAHYTAALSVKGFDDRQIQTLRDFLETDSGDDFVVVNFIELRATPEPEG